MNAYKLADELENYVWMNPNNNRDYCKEVKEMLRQQADRIANYERWEKRWSERVARAENRIAELEKDLEGCEYFLKAQTKPCEPLCKPSICNCIKEEK